MELRNFYKFIPVSNLITIQKSIQRLGDSLGVKGTILLAHEGINASISGYTNDVLIQLQSHIETLLNTTFPPLITNLKEHDSHATELPFKKFKVRIRPEIVTLGVEHLNPSCVTGEFVSPHHWNELIKDPNTITIDTRNTYEYLIGHFKNAVNPETDTFRDFIDYIKSFYDSTTSEKNIAMYCTGGIRCEKATSFMKSLQENHLYQLQGGILAYFQQVPPQEHLWEGACFVFDDRIAVASDMSPSVLQYHNIPTKLHQETQGTRHARHIYKKIMSITQH